jgi:DNA-binding PadR family transcriptional regulator
MRVPVPDDLILGLLAAEPMHGYELLGRFAAPSELGRVWTMGRSQVYAVLKRLEENGLIRGRTKRGQDAPDRVVFVVTAAGLRRLEHWLAESPLSPSVRSIRVEFISRLHVAERLGRPIGPIVDRQHDVCGERLAGLAAARRSAATATERRSLDFVIGQQRAALAWLEDLVASLGPTEGSPGAPMLDLHSTKTILPIGD